MARLPDLAGHFGVGQTLADNAGDGKVKSLGVITLAVIESECLFIQIAKQMKRFNANVCAFETALQEAPKVLKGLSLILCK
jgi:hypothetical protein